MYILPAVILKPNTHPYPKPKGNESVLDYAVRIYNLTGRYPQRRKIFAKYYMTVQASKDLHLIANWLNNYSMSGRFWSCLDNWWIFDNDNDAMVFKLTFN